MKKLIPISLLFILAFMLAASANAQTKSKVSGNVVDEKQKAIDFATVSILSSKDSAVVKTTSTDSAGTYRFEKVASGDYLIAIHFFGYKKWVSKVMPITADQTVIIPTVTLAYDSKILNEVSVTAKKPFIERRADKLIVNVEGSSVAVGNTALEVLRKAPGVSLDKDDNISMNGKNGVLVMMDGKPTYMSNADLANMLRSMQSSQIETIELITNPPLCEI